MYILIVVIGISLLILIHELGHFLAARKFGLLVEEFGFGFPPRLFAKKIGETLYSLNLLPFGGFVRLYGENQWEKTDPEKQKRSFFNQPAWKRTLVIIAGVVMNFLIGWMLMSSVFMIGTPRALLVSEVLPGSPAEQVGILPQDQLKGFDTAPSFISYIDQNRGKEISVKVVRQGKEMEFKATPRLTGQGALGVAVMEAGIERHSFFASFWEGLKASWAMITGILIALLNLVWGIITQGKVLIDFVGPVGIFGIANEAGSLGFVYLIQLLAMISLNLAVLNVLPFPALDGGRLLFILVEKIKGSPLRLELERSVNAAGFLLLLILIIAVSIRDVIRLF
ncbi:MAG: site-2 protease family protein [bacterium]|nr:site-2 protease family protein [bacterium]